MSYQELIHHSYSGNPSHKKVISNFNSVIKIRVGAMDLPEDIDLKRIDETLKELVKFRSSFSTTEKII